MEKYAQAENKKMQKREMCSAICVKMKKEWSVSAHAYLDVPRTVPEGHLRNAHQSLPLRKELVGAGRKQFIYIYKRRLSLLVMDGIGREANNKLQCRPRFVCDWGRTVEVGEQRGAPDSAWWNQGRLPRGGAASDEAPRPSGGEGKMLVRAFPAAGTA